MSNNPQRDLINVTPGTVRADSPVVADRDKNAGRVVVCEERTFSEAGDTTYTGTVTVPAGAYILDIIVQNDTLWDDGTSALMKVGDADDDDGFYTSVDLKATDLLAAETLSFAAAGGVEGAYFTGTLTHIKGLHNSADREIKGIVTTGGQNGSAGVTRMAVVYAVPTSSAAVAA